MKKNIAILFFILVCVTACSKKTIPGVQATASLLPDKLSDFQYVKADLTITLNEKFKPLKTGYDIFFRIRDPRSKKMLVDDRFDPPQQTIAWRAGKTYSFSRIEFIPSFTGEPSIDLENSLPVEMTIGLIDPKLSGDEFVLVEKKLNLSPAAYSAPQIIYESGFHDQEIDPQAKDPFYSGWRWTTKKATCIIENPGREAALIINGRVDKTMLLEQKITLTINNNLIAEFSPTTSMFQKRFVIKPEIMGSNDEFTLTVETDKTFIPAQIIKGAADTRELGVAIYPIYFREYLFPIWKSEIVYGDGWYDEEKDNRAPSPFLKSWRWTTRKAVCLIDNPRADSQLTIYGRVNKSSIPDQKVTIRINNTVVDEFVPTGTNFIRKIALNLETLGSIDPFEMTIETDKTFIPAQTGGSASDTRELGMQIYSVKLEKATRAKTQ